MPTQLDFDHPIPGSYLLTGASASRGYRLNRFCKSLQESANREVFKRDELACMRSHDLSDEEIAMVQRRDWLAMVRYGASHFLVFRLSGTLGVGLAATGAQMRGETLEEFMQTRKIAGAR
jgi:protocatechuate 4,5-dioxygenase alpha subunit